MSADCRTTTPGRHIDRNIGRVSVEILADISVDMSVNMSTDTSQSIHGPSVGRHVDDISVEHRSICRLTLDRYVGRYVDRSVDRSGFSTCSHRMVMTKCYIVTGALKYSQFLHTLLHEESEKLSPWSLQVSTVLATEDNRGYLSELKIFILYAHHTCSEKSFPQYHYAAHLSSGIFLFECLNKVLQLDLFSGGSLIL